MKTLFKLLMRKLLGIETERPPKLSAHMQRRLSRPHL